MPDVAGGKIPPTITYPTPKLSTEKGEGLTSAFGIIRKVRIGPFPAFLRIKNEKKVVNFALSGNGWGEHGGKSERIKRKDPFRRLCAGMGLTIYVFNLSPPQFHS